MKLFYLQEKSSGGSCLGTQPVAMTSMHQAMLSEGQYFVKTNKSPPIILLFAALFHLIICCTTQSDEDVPSYFLQSHEVEAIFAKKVPRVKGNKSQKWLVGAIGSSD